MNQKKAGVLFVSACAVIFVLISLYNNRLTQFDLTRTTFKFPNFQSLGFLTYANNVKEESDNQTTMEEINMVSIFINTTVIVTPTIPIAAGFPEASKCVPNYKILQTLEKRTNVKKTAFLLLSAYEYSDQIIVTLQADGWNGTPVFCRYLNENFDEVGDPVSSSIFYISTVPCCLKKGTKYMSVTFNETQPIKQWTALNDRTMTEPRYNVSLCLAPIFGDETKWMMLAETIEHYRLQGVQHYYIYIKDMDTYSRYLVEDYLRSGEIEVIWFDYRQDRHHIDWQLVGINDCLHRARSHSKYAIFDDMDERIIPTGNETLLELVTQEFGKNENIGGLTFAPRYVLRDKPVPKTYEGPETIKECLPTLIFHNTSHWAGPGFVPKMIIDPKKVLVMWIHWVNLYASGYIGAEIPPERAYIRHYRDINMRDWGKNNLADIAKFGAFQYSDYPPELMKILYKNILERLERVYIEILPVP